MDFSLGGEPLLGRIRRWRAPGRGSAPLGVDDLDMVEEISLDPTKFTIQYAAHLRRALPKAEVDITGELELEARVYGRGPESIWLERAHLRCARQSDNVRRLFAEHVAITVTNLKDDRRFRRSQLRVVIRPVTHVHAHDRLLDDHVFVVAYLTAGELAVVCVVDRPASVIDLTSRHLPALRLSPAKAVARAERNMRGWARRTIKALGGPGPNIIEAGGDYYMSSLFAFPQFWRSVARKAGGDLLVAVPAPDLIMVWRAIGPDGPKGLAEAARAELAKAYLPLSDQVFRWSESGWAPLTIA